LDGANFGGQFVREMRDGMRLTCRLSFERLFILGLQWSERVPFSRGRTLGKLSPRPLNQDEPWKSAKHFM
jgi:hypothetical protein